MTRGRGDLRNDHLVDVGAARLDVFGFDPGASQQFGNVFRIFWKIDKFAQPVNGKFHFVAMSFRAKSRSRAAIDPQSPCERFGELAPTLGMTRVCSRELFQKPQVILREEPDIGNFE